MTALERTAVPVTDEQITAAQEYLDIHRRRVKAECHSCNAAPQLIFGFAEQFAIARFLGAIGFELAEYVDEERIEILEKANYSSPEERIISHAKIVAGPERGEPGDTLKERLTQDDDFDWEGYKDSMIRMGRRGVFSAPDGAMIGGEYDELDKVNGVTRQEIIPEVTDIQW